MRLDLDVRRVWQCPACGRQLRSEGNAVARTCGCTREGVAMRLVELPRPKPIVRIPEPAEDIPELADFPTDIPVNPQPKRPPSEASADPSVIEDRDPPNTEARSTSPE